MQPVVQFTDVTKRYGNVTAVDHLNLTVEHGSVIALLGPNGAGKTTTISMMLGLSRPTSGQVHLLGKDPTLPENRARVGAMLQEVSLPQKLSVLELIHLFRSYYPNSLPADQLLKMANLEAVSKSEAAKLSGGQQRRLQFALSMAGDPRVLFLDEPTTGMDVGARRNFWQQLHEFAALDGRTILFSTHHLEEVDATAHRVVVIQKGRVVADGSPFELKNMVGFKYVSFVMTDATAGGKLQALPFIDSLERNGSKVRIRTKHSDDVLRALFTQDYPIEQVEVTSGGFEDAFLSITNADESEVAAI